MSLILLVASAVLLAIATLIGFGAITAPHELGWVAAGLLAYVLSVLAGAVPWRPGPPA